MLLQRQPPFKPSCAVCVWASESVVTPACNCGLFVEAQHITWRLAQSLRRLLMVTVCCRPRNARRFKKQDWAGLIRTAALQSQSQDWEHHCNYQRKEMQLGPRRFSLCGTFLNPKDKLGLRSWRNSEYIIFTMRAIRQNLIQKKKNPRKESAER